MVMRLTARTMNSITFSASERCKKLATPLAKLVVSSVVVLLFCQHPGRCDLGIEGKDIIEVALIACLEAAVTLQDKMKRHTDTKQK